MESRCFCKQTYSEVVRISDMKLYFICQTMEISQYEVYIQISLKIRHVNTVNVIAMNICVMSVGRSQ
jgi:hypothetical protein